MTPTVLVVGESSGGRLAGASLEAVGTARRLAASGGEVVGFLAGAGSAATSGVRLRWKVARAARTSVSWSKSNAFARAWRS